MPNSPNNLSRKDFIWKSVDVENLVCKVEEMNRERLKEMFPPIKTIDTSSIDNMSVERAYLPTTATTNNNIKFDISTANTTANYFRRP